jgi:hypothetical protein
MATKEVVKPKVVTEVPLYQDPFRPVLFDSPVLQTSPEQEKYIREVLDICCSDSASAKKCYNALQYILTTAPPVAPVLSSLTPSTTVIDVPVSVSVAGTGFLDGASVHVDGSAVPTTFVSETELTFSPVVAAEGTQVVIVENPDLLVSESLDFTVTPVLRSAPTDKKDLGPELKKEYEIKDKTPIHHGQEKK